MTENTRANAAKIIVSPEFRRRVLAHGRCRARLGASGWMGEADLDDAIADFALNQLQYGETEDLPSLVGLFPSFIGQRAARAQKKLGEERDSGAVWQFKHVELTPDMPLTAPPGEIHNIEHTVSLQDLADAQEFVNPGGRFPARQVVLEALAKHFTEYKNRADFSRRFGVSRKSLGEVLDLLDEFNAQRVAASRARAAARAARRSGT